MKERFLDLMRGRAGVVLLGLLLGIFTLLGNVRFLDTETFQITNKHKPPFIKQGHFYLNKTVRNLLVHHQGIDPSGFTVSFRAKLARRAALQVKFVQNASPCEITIKEDGQKYRHRNWIDFQGKFDGKKMAILADGQELAGCNFDRSAPIQLGINKETEPVFLDDFEIQNYAGEVLYYENFGANVYGFFGWLICILGGILFALALSIAEEFLILRIRPGHPRKVLRSGFFFGWLLLALMTPWLWMTFPGLNLGLVFIAGLAFRIFAIKGATISEQRPDKGSLTIAVTLLIAGSIWLATILYQLIITAVGAEQSSGFIQGLLSLQPAAVLSLAALIPCVITIIAAAFSRPARQSLIPVTLAVVASIFAYALFYKAPENLHAMALAITFGIWCVYLLSFIVGNRKSFPLSGPASLLLFAAVLCIFEIGIRVSPYDARFRPMATGKSHVPDKGLFFVPEDFFVTWDGKPGEAFVTTELNFRSGRPEIPKPDGTFRILTLGGSNTWGDGIDDADQTFSGVLGNLLQQKYPDRKIEVVNGGMKGYILFQILMMLKDFVLPYQPDLIILYANRNDASTQFGPYTLRELWEQRGNLPDIDQVSETVVREMTTGEKLRTFMQKSRLYNGLVQVIVGVRETSLKKVSRKLNITKEVNPISDYKRNLSEFIALCRENGIALVLADEYEYWKIQPDEKSRQIHIRQIMKQAAKEQSVPYLPIHDIFVEKYPNGEMVFATDLVHLNPKGHRTVAELLTDFIEKNELLNR